MAAKYQRVATTNQEKKGFSSQTKRFSSQLHPVGDSTLFTLEIKNPKCCRNDVFVFQNENPGPGSYGCVSTAEVKIPSFSKKGTTGFVASKVRNSYCSFLFVGPRS